MKFRVFACCLIPFLFSCRFCNGQAPSIQWARCYGGTDVEFCFSINNTSDGGFIIGGETYSNDGDVHGNHSANFLSDLWLLKMDSLGNFQWQKCLGAIVGNEQANAVRQTPDNGYIIAGGANFNGEDVSGNHGSYDFWIVKTDSVGVIQWQKSFGGSDDDVSHDIQRTIDGGYIVAGRSDSYDGDVTGNHNWDMWVVKLDSSGTLQWQKALGSYSWDEGNGVLQTNDGGFIISGFASENSGDVSGVHDSLGQGDVWLVKLDFNGNLQWQKCFGGSGPEGDIGGLVPSADGGYFIGAIAGSYDGDVTGFNGLADFWLIKTDSIGNLIWQKCYGTGGYEGTYSIASASDGGVILGGFATNNNCGTNGYDNYLVIKTDSLGNMEWSKCLGGSGQDELYSLKETPDGGVIIAGYSNSNDGDVSGNHGGTCPTPTGLCEDIWVVKLAPLGASVDELSTLSGFTTYLNAVGNFIVSFFANGQEKIETELLDITGRLLFKQPLTITEGFNKKEIQTTPFSPGIYLIRLETSSGSVTRKVVVE